MVADSGTGGGVFFAQHVQCDARKNVFSRLYAADGIPHLVHTDRESIKLAPSLCISEEALLEGLDALTEAIELAVSRPAAGGGNAP